MASMDMEIESLVQSLLRAFEVNGTAYSVSERRRECREALITAFRLGEQLNVDIKRAAGWQPIETAPPTSGHGLHVLLYVPSFGLGSLVVEGWVNDAHPGSPWVAQNGGQIQPTLWMPLPSSQFLEHYHARLG